jgi:NAD(P)-dependent dehydrogenase (short-subunit alcohol dehydrogenase family)
LEINSSTFLVVGGGSGLGEATARMIAEAGGNVLIADINEETGENVAGDLGEKAKFVRTDVTDEGSVQEAVDTAVETFGGLHGAVNCAGIGTAARVLGRKGPHPLDLFENVIQINLIGTFNVTRLAGARISEGEPKEDGERGVIVNTASVAAYDGQIGQAAYSASKGGIVSMTLPIAREFARFGIRVVTIAPGTFNTPMVETLPEDARESLGKQVPFPSRLGEPAEFAALAKHIIENRMLNGEVIRLDGAIRMAPR